jgi:hypothetical protein
MIRLSPQDLDRLENARLDREGTAMDKALTPKLTKRKRHFEPTTPPPAEWKQLLEYLDHKDPST